MKKVNYDLVCSTGNAIPRERRASDGILINGDFTVPLGTQLYLDVNPCY